MVILSGCRNPVFFGEDTPAEEPALEAPGPVRSSVANYAAYYGGLTASAVDKLARFDLVIIHPDLNLSLSMNELRSAVNRIQTTGPRTTVIAYISVGEDVRVTPHFDVVHGQYQPDWQALQADRRLYDPDDDSFTGPVTDPRPGAPHPEGAPIPNYHETGDTSGSGGWASYYLDDGDVNNNGGGDHRPDYNPNFGSFLVNIGDPAWYTSLRWRTRAGNDHYGINQLVGTGGLGCDGLFLDTIDTMGPNSYTNAGDPVPSEYEWTAPGLSEFLGRVTRDYPNAIIVQNRGLFFFDPRLAHYDHNAGAQVDYVMFESYRLDSRTDVTWTPQYYRENKKRIRQLLMTEARNPGGTPASGGFEVLSLGYAEGPGAEAEVTADVDEATASGFLHYITNDRLTKIRRDAFDARDPDVNPDTMEPQWSSTGYVNLDPLWHDAYSQPLVPRVGIQTAVASGDDSAELTFDLALDRDPVEYIVYRLDTTDSTVGQIPTGDVFIAQAAEVVVSPEINPDYATQYQDGFPVYTTQNEPPPAFTSRVEGFASGRRYHLLLRARDASGNETSNTTLTELVF